MLLGIQTWVELYTMDSGKEKQSCGPSGPSFTWHDFLDTRLLKYAIASEVQTRLGEPSSDSDVKLREVTELFFLSQSITSSYCGT